MCYLQNLKLQFEGSVCSEGAVITHLIMLLNIKHDYILPHFPSPHTAAASLPLSFISSHASESLCSRTVRMNIHTNNQVTRIYNVIGRIRGALEPGKTNRRTVSSFQLVRREHNSDICIIIIAYTRFFMLRSLF